MYQAQLFIWKVKYIIVVKTKYFIKIIGSSKTAQWQYMNQVLKHALFKKTFASQKKSSMGKQSGTHKQK